MKKIIHILASFLTTVLLMFILAKLSFIWTGSTRTQGQVVVTVRLTKAVVKSCRDYTEQELKTIPMHMRQAQLCEQNGIPYQLKIITDKKSIVDEMMNPQTNQGDHPMNIQKTVTLAPGVYQFNIELVPTAKNTAMPSYIFDDRLVVESGKKVFVTLDEDRNKFMTY